MIAAIGEPATILPPLVDETVGRDIGDQVFERLAVLAPGGAPIDTAAYRPALAESWERRDSLTWRFRLRPGARWHDGRPITSQDVRFSFEAFSDSALGSVAQPYLAGKVEVIPEDSTTFLVRFAEPSPEQLYDATYHVRVIPRHVWEAVPRSDVGRGHQHGAAGGSGPYRVERWERGQFLILAADSASLSRPGIRRAIWRFTSDPDAALNLVLSHEADLLETAIGPERAKRAAADSTVQLISYPSAAYGFLGFNFQDQGRRGPHPVLGDGIPGERSHGRGPLGAGAIRVRRGGEGTARPDVTAALDLERQHPHAAIRHGRGEQALEDAGWRCRPASGVRRRGARRLAFDILVPSTSGSRRQLAVQLQEAWRKLGAEVTVTAVDFPVFQERLGKGGSTATSARGWTSRLPGVSRTNGAGPDGRRSTTGGMPAPRSTRCSRRCRAGAGPEREAELFGARWRPSTATRPRFFSTRPPNCGSIAADQNIAIDPYSWASGLREWRADGP